MSGIVLYKNNTLALLSAFTKDFFNQTENLVE